MWYVFTMSENGYFYSWAHRIPENDDLMKYAREKNVYTIQAFRSKKQALKTAALMNISRVTWQIKPNAKVSKTHTAQII